MIDFICNSILCDATPALSADLISIESSVVGIKFYD